MKTFIKEHPYLTTFIVFAILFTIRFITVTMIVKKEVAKALSDDTMPEPQPAPDWQQYQTEN
jgi:hypothetical protein